MADARTGLDTGYYGVFHAAPDEACSASRDKYIDEANCFHYLVRRPVIRILYEAYQFLGKTGVFKAEMDGVYHRFI